VSGVVGIHFLCRLEGEFAIMVIFFHGEGEGVAEGGAVGRRSVLLVMVVGGDGRVGVSCVVVETGLCSGGVLLMRKTSGGFPGGGGGAAKVVGAIDIDGLGR